VLQRGLVEDNENPGEASILRGLRAMVRGHKITQLEAVASAARRLIEGLRAARSLAAREAQDELVVLLDELNGKDRRLRVTPSAADIEPPRYERTEEIDES
jgi:hypothetical protein